VEAALGEDFDGGIQDARPLVRFGFSRLQKRVTFPCLSGSCTAERSGGLNEGSFR
jgi:hypothetical protein